MISELLKTYNVFKKIIVEVAKFFASVINYFLVLIRCLVETLIICDKALSLQQDILAENLSDLLNSNDFHQIERQRASWKPLDSIHNGIQYKLILIWDRQPKPIGFTANIDDTYVGMRKYSNKCQRLFGSTDPRNLMDFYKKKFIPDRSNYFNFDLSRYGDSITSYYKNPKLSFKYITEE